MLNENNELGLIRKLLKENNYRFYSVVGRNEVQIPRVTR